MRFLILMTALLLSACQSPLSLQRLSRPNARNVADSGGYLYEISKGTTRFHLYGTMHLAPMGKKLPLKHSVLQTLAQSDRVFVELVLPEYADEPGHVAQASQPASANLLEQFAEKGATIGAKPTKYCNFTFAGPDYWVSYLAIREGILLRGLETLEERVALFKKIPQDDLKKSPLYRELQKVVKTKALSEREERTACQEVQSQWNDWYAENSAETEKRADRAADDPLMKVLVLERNALFYQRMQSALQDQRKTLFVMGAAHLYGKDGLLQRFRADGYALKLLK